jgi:demethoxyubiquinone hydroxylase (CLK1/Coq7/Cat5 family)
MARNMQKITEHVLRDLHARESMRLGWYRQVARGGEMIQHLRERKAQHQAFLMDLLRRRELEPAWYARYFYYMGHLFGWCTALLPDRFARWVENTLEFWILMRYQRYLKELKLDFNLRSMIEAMQMRKLPHSEPGEDVLRALEVFTSDQEKILARG